MFLQNDSLTRSCQFVNEMQLIKSPYCKQLYFSQNDVKTVYTKKTYYENNFPSYFLKPSLTVKMNFILEKWYTVSKFLGDAVLQLSLSYYSNFWDTIYFIG